MSALSGVRVVEMAGLAPVPFAGMALADFGADVIRIDRAAPTYPDVLARGKRSITIDLKQKAGVDTVALLTDAADVIIEPFRPGVMEKLGLGPEILCKRNPRLIYARLTGFGQTGPLAPAAGHDINYLAASGMLSTLARAGETPLPPLNLLADFAGGGLTCAFGITLALLERAKSGKGQVIDCAMMDSVVYLSSMIFKFRSMGAWSDAPGTNMLDSAAHFYESYKTKDGKFVSVGAIEPQFYAALLKGLGIDPATLPDQNDSESWPRMKKVFADRFIEKTRDEWVATFEGLDACFSPVLTIPELSTDAHAVSRSLFIPADDGTQEAAPAPKLSRTPGTSTALPCPSKGQHSLEILTSPDWGKLTVEAATALIQKGIVADSSLSSKL